MASETNLQDAGSVPARVLLVEDNAIVAQTTVDLLLEIGSEQVVVARSVAEAQSRCDEYQFDFALLDLNLGNEKSIAIAHRLRKANVPFAFASGFDDPSQIPASLGHYPILRKPYLLADLERTVRDYRSGV